MGAATYGRRGVKERTRVSGKRPIGAAGYKRQHNQASWVSLPDTPPTTPCRPTPSARRRNNPSPPNTLHHLPPTTPTCGTRGNGRTTHTPWTERGVCGVHDVRAARRIEHGADKLKVVMCLCRGKVDILGPKSRCCKGFPQSVWNDRLDARGQQQGHLPSSVWTRHRAEQ